MGPQAPTRLAIAMVLAVAALAGCSGGDQPIAPAPAIPGASPSGSPTQRAAQASPTAGRTPSLPEARAEVQAYLDSWRVDGPAISSQTYLVPDQQVTNDADGPHLASGRVTGVRDAQPAPDGARFPVTLELPFDGDPIAWGQGSNDRFVTFTWRGGNIPYAMSFATGP